MTKIVIPSAVLVIPSAVLVIPSEARNLPHDLPQHLRQVGILRERQQRRDIFQRIGQALDEIGLAFEEAAVAVGAEHLQGPEEDKEAEMPAENGLRDVRIRGQGFPVSGDHLLLEILGILRPGLPDEGGEVVVDWATAAALVVDEAGLSILEHNIPGLEIAVEEGLRGHGEEVGLEPFEIGLQLQFVEFRPDELEEVVFEVIEVEIDHLRVERLLRITHRPVEPVGTFELQAGQLTDRGKEEVPLLRIIFSALPAACEGVIERLRAEVFLEITEAVLRHGQHLRHRQSLGVEMAAEGDESAVFVGVRSDGTDDAAGRAGHPAVGAVTAGNRKGLRSKRRGAEMIRIELKQSVHGVFRPQMYYFFLSHDEGKYKKECYLCKLV